MKASWRHFLSVPSLCVLLLGGAGACGDDDDAVSTDRADGGGDGGGGDAGGDTGGAGIGDVGGGGGTDAGSAGDAPPASDAPSAGDMAGASTEYVLDVSMITAQAGATPGDLVLAAGDLLVFPLDLTAQTRPIAALGPNTLEKFTTTASCAGLADATQRTAVLAALEPAARPGGMFVQLSGIRLDLPHQASQDPTPRVPTTLCFGYRTQSGTWLFPAGGLHASTVEGTMSSFIQVMPSAILPHVDALAVLVDAPSVVRRIRFYTGP